MSVTEVGNSSQIVQLTGLRKKESPRTLAEVGNSSQIVQSTVLRKKESPQSFAHASQALKESSTLGSSRCAGCK
jgi:hypothetical protein